MKKYSILILILLFSICGIGSAQTLSVGQGYKHGDIYWQSSVDGQTWADIADENALEYDIPSNTNKQYRAKVVSVSNSEVYYSSVYKAGKLKAKSTISFSVPANTNRDNIKVSFAPLKYNKRFAISYTSDDQKLDGWRTFKYFNGGWIDNERYIHWQEARTGGGYAPRALTYTDGCGITRRFSVNSANFFNRQYDKNTDKYYIEKTNATYIWGHGELTWGEQLDINDFDGACSFHDVVYNKKKEDMTIQEIKDGIIESNNIIANRLKLSRKPMVMIEPNGDDRYIDIANELPQFKLLARENTNDGFGCVNLADETLDYNKLRVSRKFADGIVKGHKDSLVKVFQKEIITPSYKKDTAMYRDLGGHGFESTYLDGSVDHTINGIGKSERIKFFDWLCNNHGAGIENGRKGADDMWFGTCDEIIQYKLLNKETLIDWNIDDNNIMTITLEVPELEDFYWYEYTLLIDGLNIAPKVQVDEDDSVQGYSSGMSNGKMMINLNYDETLMTRAEKYTSLFEKATTTDMKDEYKRDAEYFIKRLRPSHDRENLILRLDNKPIKQKSIAVVSLSGIEYSQVVTHKQVNNKTINLIYPNIYNNLNSLVLTSTQGDVLNWKVEKNSSFYQPNSESNVNGSYLISANPINPTSFQGECMYSNDNITRAWSLAGTGEGANSNGAIVKSMKKGRLVFTLPNGKYKFSMLMSVKAGSDGVIPPDALTSCWYRVDASGAIGEPINVGSPGFTGANNTEFNATRTITVKDGGKAGNVVFYLYNDLQTRLLYYKPSINLIQIEKID